MSAAWIDYAVFGLMTITSIANVSIAWAIQRSERARRNRSPVALEGVADELAALRRELREQGDAMAREWRP